MFASRFCVCITCFSLGLPVLCCLDLNCELCCTVIMTCAALQSHTHSRWHPRRHAATKTCPPRVVSVCVLAVAMQAHCPVGLACLEAKGMAIPHLLHKAEEIHVFVCVSQHLAAHRIVIRLLKFLVSGVEGCCN